jgi:chromosomal replication initiator protein
MTNVECLWTAALSYLGDKISPHEIATWFGATALAEATADQAVISVPDALHARWFEERYCSLLADALEPNLGSRPKITIEVVRKESSAPHIQQLPLPAVPPRRVVRDPDLHLNRRYTFDRFVTGPSNQFAHAAALAVVEQPGRAYNPLFLHGDVGLGKTHLMHAVAYALLERQPDRRVKCLSGKSFMDQFVYAAGKGALAEFRRRFRGVDVLLIDDIHAIARRTGTQEEFFHTFNELYNAERQIILSSDSPPQDIPTLEERMVSRFRWGLVARIDSPGVEMRRQIVRKKSAARQTALPEDVVDFLAESGDGSIRELEGAVQNVIGFAQATRRPVTLAVARELVFAERVGQAPAAPITCARVQEVVGEWFGVNPEQMRARTRARAVAFPRQMAMYLSRELTGQSLAEVGRAFGGRDHSTVAHACRRIERESEKKPELGATVESLRKTVRGSGA